MAEFRFRYSDADRAVVRSYFRTENSDRALEWIEIAASDWLTYSVNPLSLEGLREERDELVHAAKLILKHRNSFLLGLYVWEHGGDKIFDGDPAALFQLRASLFEACGIIRDADSAMGRLIEELKGERFYKVETWRDTFVFNVADTYSKYTGKKIGRSKAGGNAAKFLCDCLNPVLQFAKREWNLDLGKPCDLQNAGSLLVRALDRSPIVMGQTPPDFVEPLP